MISIVLAPWGDEKLFGAWSSVRFSLRSSQFGDGDCSWIQFDMATGERCTKKSRKVALTSWACVPLGDGFAVVVEIKLDEAPMQSCSSSFFGKPSPEHSASALSKLNFGVPLATPVPFCTAIPGQALAQPVPPNPKIKTGQGTSGDWAGKEVTRQKAKSERFVDRSAAYFGNRTAVFVSRSAAYGIVSKSRFRKSLSYKHLSSEGDGTRTRNHRIDSPVL